jgi:type II secretory pathway component PulM
MNLEKLLNFWTSLQTRERLLLKIVGILIIISFSISYVFQSAVTVNQSNDNLEAVKKDFEYVYNKANNFLIYSKSQNTLNEFTTSNEFLLSEAKIFNLLTFRLVEEDGQNILLFSDSSIENVTRFLQSVISNPSISIASVLIEPGLGNYNFKIFLTNN